MDGENVQLFKELKLAMDKYALHYDFHAIDMDNVDIVLGYRWMQSVGTINPKIEKKFLKLWYKKKKVTLQEIFLSQLAASKAEHDVVSTGTLEVIPIHTSDNVSMVSDTTNDLIAPKDMT